MSLCVTRISPLSGMRRGAELCKVASHTPLPVQADWFRCTVPPLPHNAVLLSRPRAWLTLPSPPLPHRRRPQVHVDAVRCFLALPVEAKVVKTVPERALEDKGKFNV